MAQTTQGLGLQVFDFATDSTPSFVNGVAGLEGSNMHKIDEAITNKVQTNGEASNVNFIENRVVQDGLVNKNFELSFSVNNTGVLYTLHKVKIKRGMASSHISVFNTSEGIATTGTNSDNFSLKYNILGTIIRYSVGDSDIFYIHETLYNFETKLATFRLLSTNGDVVYSDTLKNFTNDASLIKSFTFFKDDYRDTTIGLAYNRQLNSQEIQHNLSILNNTPSINRINDYAISTDTDHIQDRTGRTTEQINRVFYKNMCKEFTSNGGDIVVNNGMDGYVLSATLQGQTVKNLYEFNKNMIITVSSNDNATISVKRVYTEKNTTYNAVFHVSSMTGSPRLDFRTLQGMVSFSNIKLGLNNISFTTSSTDSSANPGYLRIDGGVEVSGNTLVLSFFNVVENGQGIFVKDWLPFGLSSTPAVISNLGVKYSFYSLTDDKLNNKVIMLGGVGDVRDTLEIKEDGSGVLTSNTKEVVLNGGENWIYFDVYKQFYISGISGMPTSKDSSIIVISDKLKPKSFNSRLTFEDMTCAGGGTSKNICIFTDKYTTVEDFKIWLASNTVTVRYQLDTPIVTTIPKELVPTILTQATNEFKFGDAVMATKATISVPVNRIADFETRIAQLEKVITSTSNLAILGNYAEDEYNKEINQL